MCTLPVAFRRPVTVPNDARCAAGALYSTRSVVVAEGPALPEPPPPTTGLCGAVHSWRFLPPVCPGAVVVTGSLTHTRRRVASLTRTNSLHAHRFCFLDPLVGRWTPWWGVAGRWCLLSCTSAFINPLPTCLKARCGTYIGVDAVGGRVLCEAGADRGRWSGRDTHTHTNTHTLTHAHTPCGNSEFFTN